MNANCKLSRGSLPARALPKPPGIRVLLCVCCAVIPTFTYNIPLLFLVEKPFDILFQSLLQKQNVSINSLITVGFFQLLFHPLFNLIALSKRGGQKCCSGLCGRLWVYYETIECTGRARVNRDEMSRGHYALSGPNICAAIQLLLRRSTRSAK